MDIIGNRSEGRSRRSAILSRVLSSASLARVSVDSAPLGLNGMRPEDMNLCEDRYLALEQLCDSEGVFLNRLSLLVKHYIAPLEEIASGASLSQRRATARVSVGCVCCSCVRRSSLATAITSALGWLVDTRRWPSLSVAKRYEVIW